MDSSSIFLLVGGILLLAAGGAMAVTAGRHGRTSADRPGGAPSGHQPSTPVGAEDHRPPTKIETTGSRETVPAPRLEVLQVQRVVEVSAEEGGVTRRQFFNRALAGSFGAFATIAGLNALAFFWPRLSGGFGGKVDAGPIEDIRALLTQSDGSLAPFVVSEARAYIVPIEPGQVEGSQFNEQGLVAEGLMAMWWRCVHLGCRAPWCAPSGGFECPCHGSKYNLLGEYQAGPAPRNLDRFVVEVSSDGRLIIDTGAVVQTPRAPANTVPYPRGPACISL
jgi:cytochrome b6-f complex iron-sulfur subunit